MKTWVRILFTSLAAAGFVALSFIPIPGMETAAQRTLGVFVLALILWMSEAIPLYVTSFVIAALLAIFVPQHIEGVDFKAFLEPFFSPVILLFLGGFVLARGLEQYDLDSVLASAILRRVGKRPWAILAGFMGVTAILSMWMSNTAATALMIAVALPLIGSMDKNDPMKIGMLLGIPFAANLGGMATPIGTPPNAIAIANLRDAGVTVNFLEWMGLALPAAIILLVLTWVLILLLFKPKTKTLTFSLERKTKRMGWKEWLVLGTLLVTILGWLTGRLHKIPDAIVALVPVLVFFAFGLLGRKDFRSLGWDVLILMGGGLSLGSAVSASGLDTWLVSSLGMEGLPPVALFIGFILITVVLTNFISNTSSAALIVPLAMGFAVSGNSLVIGVALAASASMLLPVSTPPNAIAFGSGQLKVKHMFSTGLIIAVIALGVIMLFGLLIWPRLGLI
ncbi:DASS family sodium-coupled anion symporter [candidate division WOR-3 bacterium]|uniref:DASS family sodium-coupled anion symporter n=1 Tax=candidate division WOR-3 bacterium TaxID=2052148 RepID=A0A9D5K8Y3_UNCW3|nr:DASS family sodium-coupled anion symporter [candidate division WOR-3 bacterium]MBD3364523.1 DASS family sodium-coupled anion symporter [candidate division WOR-3 bacterium]